jgi:TRAP-type transport system periplasmic protein
MFFGASREQVRDILDGPLGAELYKKVADKLHIRVVGPHFEFAPNETAYTTSKKITKYADLEGVKLATPPSPTIVAILKTIGANAVATPRNEIELQLTQGKIDGLGLVTDLTISGGKLWDAGIKYGWHDDAGWGFYIPLVSEATWDKLTPDQQKALADGWNTVKDWAREQTKKELGDAIEVNKSHGIEFSYPTADDLKATREKLLAAQGEIVEKTRLDAEFVAKVQERLKALQK